MNRKQRQVQRYERQLKHFKTLAERKQLAQLAKQRRSEDRSGGRAGDRRAEADPDGEGEAFFEKMKSHRGRPRSGREVRDAFDQVLSQARGELDATVLAVHRARVEILLGSRRESVPVPTSMSDTKRGRFVVGDRVTLTRGDADALRIRTVEPRRTEIARPDPTHARLKHVLAANVDAAVVVTSARAPVFKPGLVDRFLIVLRRGGVEPLICLNKVDLLQADEEREEIRRRLEVYGTAVLETSIEHGDGLEPLRRAIDGKTVVFVGQSGVGKSSLLNALRPELAASTGEVRAGDGKGRHTTTSSNLYDLGGSTRVIDTPGIRSLGLWEIDKHGLAAEFPEFAEHAHGCRFRDCLHAVEPECEVRAAAQRGDLERARYEAYLRILDSLED